MGTHRHRQHLTSILLVFGVVGLLAACGDDDSIGGVDLGVDDGSSGDSDGGGSSSDDAGGGSEDSDVTVTVDGTEYVVTTVQNCNTEGDDRSDLTMFGFAETGERVELSFSQQDAESSPTGAVAYYGSVGISSGEISGQVTSDEPFAFLAGDRSSVSDTVTMETTSVDASGSLEVSFDITCP